LLPAAVVGSFLLALQVSTSTAPDLLAPPAAPDPPRRRDRDPGVAAPGSPLSHTCRHRARGPAHPNAQIQSSGQLPAARSTTQQCPYNVVVVMPPFRC
jgi:hypothetical protein